MPQATRGHNFFWWLTNGGNFAPAMLPPRLKPRKHLFAYAWKSGGEYKAMLQVAQSIVGRQSKHWVEKEIH